MVLAAVAQLRCRSVVAVLLVLVVCCCHHVQMSRAWSDDELACPSAGCLASAASTASTLLLSPGESVPVDIVTSDGDERSALVFVSSAFPLSSGAAPPGGGQGERAIVFVLHGNLGTSEQIEISTEFSDLAEEEDFVVAYPQGAGSRWSLFFSFFKKEREKNRILHCESV